MGRPKKIKEEETNPEKPQITDPAWHDYVMSQFTAGEKDNDGNPNVDGLRRVTNLLMGRIIRSLANVLQVASPDNGFRSTVVHSIDILLEDGTILSYSSVADTSPENADPEYARFPSAMSDTRAEARALRKALGLRKTVSAEEITKQPVDPLAMVTMSTSSQHNAIHLLGRRTKTDISQLLNDYGCDDATGLSHSDAVEVLKKLNEYQQKPDKNPYRKDH